MPWASAQPFASNAPVLGVPGTAVPGDILYSTKPYGQGPDTIHALDPKSVRPLRTILIGGWHADLRPDGGAIAFATMIPSGDHFDIHVMCPDGSHAQRLTDNDFPSFYPRWSPDGSRISFNGFPGEVWVVNADGSGAKRIATSAAMTSWSPDGTQIAYAKGEATAASPDDIWVSSPDGTNAKDLAKNAPNDEFPSWSPDGTKIAFSSDAAGSGTSHIYVMNADGSGITQLTSGPAIDDAEMWSPDGTQIVFERQDSPNGYHDIWVMNADGSNQTNLTNTPNDDDSAPSWR
jgi:Tol biopolymer transport system component